MIDGVVICKILHKEFHDNKHWDGINLMFEHVIIDLKSRSFLNINELDVYIKQLELPVYMQVIYNSVIKPAICKYLK